MKIRLQKKLTIHLLLFFAYTSWGSDPCPLPNAIFYQSDYPLVSFDSLANLTAPILWYSPDQPRLFNKAGEITLPEPFPYDSTQQLSTVYYKIKEVYTPLSKSDFNEADEITLSSGFLDLSKTTRFEIEYHFYYSFEQGSGSHGYDMEAAIFQITVHPKSECTSALYTLEVKRVIAKAHGLYWFHNILTVDEYTQFPLAILVEEGKHASCTDKNQDGAYTPGYDVNEKPNDSWGVRDIISTGILFTGGFQAWMAKKRYPETTVFPPICKTQAPLPTNRLQVKSTTQFYGLKPFPKVPEDYPDKTLIKKVKSKKPYDWPGVHYGVLSKRPTSVERKNILRNKVGFSIVNPYPNFEITIPLLIIRHVEAPMTGGWLYHKVYTTQLNQFNNAEGTINVIGHQIRHSNSASRWLDLYIGLGYEFLDGQGELDLNEVIFVSDVGLKIRANIGLTPLKFLRFLGTNYWGVSLGWRNRGFNEFGSGSFVLAIGAGAF